MIAIKGGKVVTVTGPIVDPGTVVIEDGKIIEIRPGSSAPAGAEVIDAAGCWVMPGMIDAHSHFGLLGEPMVPAVLDVNEVTEAVTPHVRAIDAFNPDEQGLREVVSAGVTAAYTGPGSANVIGGVGFAFKMVSGWVDDVRLPGTEAMKMALGENPKRVYGTRTLPQPPATRLGNAAVLRAALINTLDYIERRSLTGKERAARDAKLEALIPVVRREMKARIHSHRADDILTALRVADEFDLSIVIEHATEGYKVARQLAERGVPCTVGPMLIGKSKMELQHVNPENPGILARAGVKVAIQVDGASTTRWLPLCAGVAVREGMPEDEAFRSVTINPAEILGISDRTGSLAEGKDADLAVFSAHPFQTMSRCILTMIDGQVVHRL